MDFYDELFACADWLALGWASTHVSLAELVFFDGKGKAL